MTIFITTPDFSLHGGIRIIVEHANRLAKWHKVILHPLKGENHYFHVNDNVIISHDINDMKYADCLIITSPHAIHYELLNIAPKKIFIFMQMVEHLFKPGDRSWKQTCDRFYHSENPMFMISKWNMEMINRKSLTYYIGNGVNLEDFPIERPDKDGKTVLFEGLIPTNPSKDSELVGYQVAQKLKRDGYYLIGYSQARYDHVTKVLNEFHYKPDLATMNDLYRRATVMVKASHFDARSCSPVEAMTKGTVTARAITKGDDDLIHEVNCLRGDYDVLDLYKNAKRLLTDTKLRIELAENGYKHLEENCNWDKIMKEVNEIICG